MSKSTRRSRIKNLRSSITALARRNSFSSLEHDDDEAAIDADIYQKTNCLWSFFKRRKHVHEKSRSDHAIVMEKVKSFVQTLMFIENGDDWCTLWSKKNNIHFSHLLADVWKYCSEVVEWKRSNEIDEISKLHEARKIRNCWFCRSMMIWSLT